MSIKYKKNNMIKATVLLITIFIVFSAVIVTADKENMKKVNNNILNLEGDPLQANAGGPYFCIIGDSIDFHGSATGGQQPYVLFEWDFGNGDSATGEDVTYTYSAVGNYTVTITVTDVGRNTSTDETFALVSEESEPILEISIQSEFGIGVNAILKNVGDGEATNVGYNLTVTGGLLKRINIEIGGTIDELAVDEEFTISTGLFLGLGAIDIYASVICNEDSFDEDGAIGFQILIFTLVS